MSRERLKDKIDWHPAPSRFASFLNVFLILLTVGAVYFSLGDGRVIENSLRFLSGSAPPPGQQQETLTVLVTPEQSFYWNEQGPYALTDFPSRLTSWLPTVKAPQVVIVAAETVRVGDATRVLDEVRRQGVTQFRLEARRLPKL